MRGLNHKAAALVVALLAALGVQAPAHHDVEEMIRQFTERLESGELDEIATAEVLYRRSTEYRVIRDLGKAQADLEKAIGLAPSYVAAHQDLGRIFQQRGDHEKALASIGRAIEASSTDREKATAHAIRAEFLMGQDKPKEALVDCQKALDTYKRGAVDWFLLRADLQEQLGITKERLDGLKAGHTRTKSVVIYNAWVEVLVETGDYEQAAPIIEARVAKARLKSSWLIRRAKLYRATEKEAAAKEDLLAAIEELNRRINPANPDITLLVDRGIAWAMLDDRSAAKRDLIAAKKAGADRWVTGRLEKVLGLKLEQR